MKKKTKNMILVSIFAALTAVGGFLTIPIPPVPFTLQTFFVKLSGLFLGGNLAFLSQIIYLILGLMGIPIFTQGGGIHYIFKPTFGYLLSFPICAYVTGKLIERTRKDHETFGQYFAIFSIDSIINYAVGLPYLYIILNYVNNINMSISQVFVTGCLIFIPWDIVKILMSAWIAKKINKLDRNHLFK